MIAMPCTTAADHDAEALRLIDDARCPQIMFLVGTNGVEALMAQAAGHLRDAERIRHEMEQS